ncbi:MAG: L,D-transpeptidase family protein [Chitinophagales bacterium]
MTFRITYLLFCNLCIFYGCKGQGAEKQQTLKIHPKTVIDSLVVYKSERIMLVFCAAVKVKSYKIALGQNPVGHKQFEGDSKTPEGIYFIDAKSAVSKYHKNLNISYPNAKDIEFAAAQNKRAGGDIKIHGLPNGYDEKNYERSDWTLGCIGLTNTEIDELYKHVKLGCPIVILP